MEYEKLYAILDKSSERTRSTVYLILVASVLIFIPYWNVNSGNWLSTRIKLRQDVIKYYGWKSSDSLKLLNKNEQKEFHNSKEAATLLGINTSTTKDSAAIINRLENDIIELKKIYISRSFISVPFFNVSIDINDLGIFGGFSLIVILLILESCLSRELKNIKYIMAVAEEQGELTQVYEFISLSQVLTKPPTENNIKPYKWYSLNQCYIILPLLVETYSFSFDLDEIQFALVQNQEATLYHICFNFASLVWIIILTIKSIKIYIEYNQQWFNAARKIYKRGDIPTIPKLPPTT